jgi:hypothetical protein
MSQNDDKVFGGNKVKQFWRGPTASSTNERCLKSVYEFSWLFQWQIACNESKGYDALTVNRLKAQWIVNTELLKHA